MKMKEIMKLLKKLKKDKTPIEEYFNKALKLHPIETKNYDEQFHSRDEDENKNRI